MKFQEQLIKRFKSRGSIVIKHIRCNVNGMPDLQICNDGQSVFIESKEGNDTLSTLQKYMIDRLRNTGFIAFALHDSKGVVYPESLTDQAKEVIDNYLKG